MLWKAEKNSKQSFLIGSAHFFPYSFRTSLVPLIRSARVVIFEGPLDEENMSKVVAAGMEKAGGDHIFDALDHQTANHIMQGIAPSWKNNKYPLLFNILSPGGEHPVYSMVKGMKPWLAFFTLWSKFLRNHGWIYSVDMEAYSIAKELDKKIVFLETIEEQIEVLESLVTEQIIDFLKRFPRWRSYSKAYVRHYLKADLENIKSNVYGFPSRNPTVIDKRDKIFFERMLNYIDEGNAVVCVGAPHIRGITRFLRAEGYMINDFENDI